MLSEVSDKMFKLLKGSIGVKVRVQYGRSVFVRGVITKAEVEGWHPKGRGENRTALIPHFNITIKVNCTDGEHERNFIVETLPPAANYDILRESLVKLEKYGLEKEAAKVKEKMNFYFPINTPNCMAVVDPQD